MLCEALTQLPHSLVFNEPNIALDQFVIRPHEARLLASQDIDLAHFVKRWSRLRRRFLFRGVQRSLFPRIAETIAQVGVKEIFHANWQRIERAFTNLSIILIARDPRDIYLSLQERYLAGHAIWEGPFTPERVAANLNEEFSFQVEMQQRHDVLKIRYEDLCIDPSLFDQVLDFVDSDIESIGTLGSFLEADHRRAGEGKLHGGIVTDKRVARWRQVDDSPQLGGAHTVFALMPEYCDFWGYEA